MENDVPMPSDYLKTPGGKQYIGERLDNKISSTAPTVDVPNLRANSQDTETHYFYEPELIISEKKTNLHNKPISPKKRANSTKPSREKNSNTVQSKEMTEADSAGKRVKSTKANTEIDKSKVLNKHKRFTEKDFDPIRVTGKALNNGASPFSGGRVNLSKPSSETNNTIPSWLENAPRILQKAYETNKFARENPDAWVQQHKQYPRQLLGLFAMQASAPLTGLVGTWAGGLIGVGGVSTVIEGAVSGTADVLIYDMVDDSTFDDYMLGAAGGAGGAMFGRYVLSPTLTKFTEWRFGRQFKKWADIDKTNVISDIDQKIAPYMRLADYGGATFEIGIRDEESIILKMAFREQLPPYIRSSSILAKQIMSLDPELPLIKTIVNDDVINKETIKILKAGGLIENTPVGSMTLKTMKLLGFKPGTPKIVGPIGVGMDIIWPVSM